MRQEMLELHEKAVAAADFRRRAAQARQAQIALEEKEEAGKKAEWEAYVRRVSFNNETRAREMGLRDSHDLSCEVCTEMTNCTRLIGKEMRPVNIGDSTCRAKDIDAPTVFDRRKVIFHVRGLAMRYSTPSAGHSKLSTIGHRVPLHAAATDKALELSKQTTASLQRLLRVLLRPMCQEHDTQDSVCVVSNCRLRARPIMVQLPHWHSRSTPPAIL